MADGAVVHIGENSPEQVAYRLMRDIAIAEKINLVGNGVNSSRDWIIRTYAQCRQVVSSPHTADKLLSEYRG